jgi:hypothetical protein
MSVVAKRDAHDDLEDVARSVVGSARPGARAPNVMMVGGEDRVVDGTVRHESVHVVLFRTTTYGYALTKLRQAIDSHGDLGATCLERLQNAYRTLFSVHRAIQESVATYVQFKSLQISRGRDKADEMMSRKPPYYVEQFNRVHAVLENDAWRIIDKENFALTLGQAVLNTCIPLEWAETSRFLDGNVAFLQDGIRHNPDTRFSALLAALSSDDVRCQVNKVVAESLPSATRFLLQDRFFHGGEFQLGPESSEWLQRNLKDCPPSEYQQRSRDLVRLKDGTIFQWINHAVFPVVHKWGTPATWDRAKQSIVKLELFLRSHDIPELPIDIEGLSSPHDFTDGLTDVSHQPSAPPDLSQMAVATKEVPFGKVVELIQTLAGRAPFVYVHFDIPPVLGQERFNIAKPVTWVFVTHVIHDKEKQIWNIATPMALPVSSNDIASLAARLRRREVICVSHMGARRGLISGIVGNPCYIKLPSCSAKGLEAALRGFGASGVSEMKACIVEWQNAGMDFFFLDIGSGVCMFSPAVRSASLKVLGACDGYGVKCAKSPGDCGIDEDQMFVLMRHFTLFGW